MNLTRKIAPAFIALIAGIQLHGQTTEDALRATIENRAGTARSMALGGAMGALGADFTSIGVNPAGIAVYRGNEFTLTPSMQFTQTESDYFGTITSDDRFNFPMQQIGYVGTFKPAHQDGTGLVSTHWSIGYSRSNSFGRRTFIQGFGLNSSILDMFVSDANEGIWDPFYNELAYATYLLDALPAGNGYLHGFEYHDVTENLIYRGPMQGVNQGRIFTERGGSGEFNMAFGANFGHQFLIGGSVGITSFSFRRELMHHEEINGGWEQYSNNYLVYRGVNDLYGIDDFSFMEKLDTRGTGINLKIGAIFKPINEIRVGAAFHTPTFQSFNDLFDTSIEVNYFIPEVVNGVPEVFDGGNRVASRHGNFSYNFRTPFKAVGSLAYIFGARGFVSMDYEYTNHEAMQFGAKTSDLIEVRAINALNQDIRETFRATHNLRFGAEFRPTEAVSLRAGYAIFQSPYQENHFKHEDSRNLLSAGVGLRMENMFVDFAYMVTTETESYSLYYSPLVPEGDQLPASITTNRHHVALTLGWRF